MTQLLDSCEKGKESMISRMEMINTGLAISWAKMALSVCNFICAMNLLAQSLEEVVLPQNRVWIIPSFCVLFMLSSLYT